ncbi:DUF6934 family protein [Chitinophaga pinensis]|uniref:Uncharacterized protein n=1 Tax=Chitinophaga pinensis TaxID=79329 RepID=A0A5C6LHX1_9BACT|nr:hypothetical protein [Chitinophaga pinensis]TWV89888.1 hypothetical protein FEF09_29715 [Chitinophaga pinensis]
MLGIHQTGGNYPPCCCQFAWHQYVFEIFNYHSLCNLMNADIYPYQTDHFCIAFEFQSEGPNGQIRKIVQYDEINQLKDGTPVLAISFGDWDEEKQDFNELKVSNNADTMKVLYTIAATIKEVTESMNVAVFGQGSTSARNRLYQMAISMQLTQIEKDFNVFGLTAFEWECFKKGSSYKAFFFTRK